MNLKYELLINQYGQDIIEINQVIMLFDGLEIMERRIFVNGLLTLLIQSKPKATDIESALSFSGLKRTYTPCVLLQKGISPANLYKVAGLPDSELKKVLVLFLNLFKIAYRRRFLMERNNSHKWWYWDLSDMNVLKKIEKLY